MYLVAVFYALSRLWILPFMVLATVEFLGRTLKARAASGLQPYRMSNWGVKPSNKMNLM